MTPNPLDAIQARADAATEAPWRIENDSECDYEQGIPYAEWPQTLVGPECAQQSDWSKKHGLTHRVDEINELKFPDAEFIAHAREDVPKLVAALRAVAAIKPWNGDYPPYDNGYNTALQDVHAAIREALNG